MLTLAARAFAAIAVVAAIVMQAVNGDWMPPRESFSQYANGRGGWLFMAVVLAMAGASACLAVLASARHRIAAVLLRLAAIGFTIDAFVPADAGGPQTAAGAVHKGAAGVALIALALAGLVVGTTLDRKQRAMGALIIGLSVIAGISLVLLLASAYGIDPTGLGQRESWALHQSIAVTSEIAALAALSVAVRPVVAS